MARTRCEPPSTRTIARPSSEAIKEGADVNAQVAGGDTPLLLAAKSGQSSSAQALIEAGADIKVRDDTGNGVLHYAAHSGMTGICGLLVDRGIAIDEKGAGGATPLQFAVQGGRVRRPPNIWFAAARASNRKTTRA